MDFAGAIDEVLCEDAEAILYRAQTREGRAVLVKTLKAAHPTSAEYESLRREAEGARVAGADVAAEPEELTTLDGRPMLVFRDDGGVSFGQLIRSPMPLARFFPLALALTNAIATIHARGLIHGNLHPADILVLWSGRVELIGFGHPVSASPPTIGARRCESTWPYIAPEQTGRVAIPVDHRADLYALGVLFFEILTGRRPFDAKDMGGLFHAHCALSPSLVTSFVPDLPTLLAEVVMKLLAKPPEARYQSAGGLAHDLERCFDAWKRQGRIAEFTLGLGDVAPPLRAGFRIHGRREEMRKLRRALDRVGRTHGVEAIFVSGPSGIGKTSVVESLRQPTTEHSALIAFAKCRPAQATFPGSTLLEALDGILQATIESSEESPDALARRLEDSLGDNLPLLGALLPRLTRIVGPQAPPPEVPIPEARDRLLMALDQLVLTCSSARRPIVIVIDDLHWADITTLEVLQHWVALPRGTPMLVVGAYRSDEVSVEHPVRRMVAAMNESGAAVGEVALRPLSSETMSDWLSDLFQCSRDVVAPLAAVVSERTGNNPFFVERLMDSLYRRNLVRYRADVRRWQWNIDEVRTEPYADDVNELIGESVRTLSPKARTDLGRFAAYSGQADLATLAVLLECPEEEVLLRLGEAFAARLVTRLGNRVSFLHDAIQQIAYAQLGDERANVHLSIGRAFLARLPLSGIVEQSFEISRHFEIARDLLAPDERVRVAELQLVAGKRAQTATHFACAVEFLARGIDLLAAEDWETHHELSFELHIALARSRFVLGELEAARIVGTALLAHSRDGGEQAAVRTLLTEIHGMQGAANDAVSEGLDALRALGVDVSPHPTKEAADAAITAVLARLESCRPCSIIELPSTKDPTSRAICDLVSSLVAPAANTDWNLLWLITAIAVDRSLAFGNASSSSISYCNLALRLATEGRHDEAFRLGEAAYDLARKESNPAHRLRTASIFLAVLSYLVLPIRECIELLRGETETAKAAGDQLFACLLLKHTIHFRLFAGDPLAEVAADIAAALGFVDRAGSAVSRSDIEALRRGTERLRDRCPSGRLVRTALDDEFDTAPSPLRRFLFLYQELLTRFVLDDQEGAARVVDEMAKLTGFATGFLAVDDFHFFAALTKSAASVSDESAAAQRLSEMRYHHEVLHRLASTAAGTFRAREELVKAEIDRLTGDDVAAERGYESAVASARSAGQAHIVAIASERAARFHIERGMVTVADAYLVQARGCYESWGALGKVSDLERAFPFLTIRPATTPELDGILEAQKAIASALRPSELNERLLDVTIVNAAAQRGCLLEVEGRSLRLAAASASRPDQRASFGEVGAFVQARQIPMSVCHSALRSKRPVVIADAALENGFGWDPYFTTVQTRSVACIPIVRDDRVVALLYLENGLVGGAFSDARMGVVHCIASLAATSLENARLYSRLEDENAERRHVEAELAEKKKLYESILDATPVTVFVKDLQGRYILVNRQFEEVCYSERSGVLGRTDHEIFPRMVADQFRNADVKVLAEDHPIEVDDEIPRADGIHTYLTIKFPLHDVTDKPYAVCGISADVTARKRADEEVRRSLSLLEATIESTADGILVTDLDGGVVTYNRRFLSMWRMPEEVMQKSKVRAGLDFAAEQLEDPASFVAKVDSLFGDTLDERLDTLLFKDGRVYERYSKPQLVAGHSVGRVWSFRDVTQRVRDAEERARLLLEEQHARSVAEEAVRLRDDFLSVASHELRTPLGALSLAVENVGAQLTPPVDVERVGRATTIAKRQVQRIASLVDMLLDVSRVRSGKLTLSPVRVDLRQVVEDVGALLTGELSRAGSELVVHAPVSVIGNWDMLRVEQIVTNLLTNAIKFGRGMPITVAVGFANEGEWAQLSVTDHGIGVPAASRASIFEPFTRLVSAQRYSGLGLGLHITKTIVEAHGGKLSVESVEGAGSTFTVMLPRDCDCADSSGVGAAEGRR